MAKPRGNIYRVGKAFRVKYPAGKDPNTGKYRYIQKDHPTEAAAIEHLNRLRVDELDGKLVPPNRITVRQFGERWLQTKQGEIEPSSVRAYRAGLESLNSFMGEIPLSKVTPDLILRWKSERLRTHHPNTVRLHQTVLNMILKSAVKWRYLSSHPGEDIELPAYVKPVRRIWNRDQMDQFLAYCETHPDGPMWRLTLMSGLRIGELCALTWDDLFGNKLTVRNTEKRGEDNYYAVGSAKSDHSARTLTLPRETLEILHRYRQAQRKYRDDVGSWWNEENWMFPTRMGTRRQTNNTRGQFVRICRDAGLPYIGPHGLRHTNGTDMMRAKVPPRVAQQRLGHHDVSVTLNLYGHPDDGMDAEAASLLERRPDSEFVGDSSQIGDKLG